MNFKRQNIIKTVLLTTYFHPGMNLPCESSPSSPLSGGFVFSILHFTLITMHVMQVVHGSPEEVQYTRETLKTLRTHLRIQLSTTDSKKRARRILRRRQAVGSPLSSTFYSAFRRGYRPRPPLQCFYSSTLVLAKLSLSRLATGLLLAL